MRPATGRVRAALLVAATTAGATAANGCRDQATPGSVAAATGPAPSERAIDIVELDLRLSDPDTAKVCPPDSYAWPACEGHNRVGYATVYAAGEPLIYAFAPAGTFDLVVVSHPAAGHPIRTARRAAVPIGEAATTVDLELTGEGLAPMVLRFQLRADPPGRADGDICALGRSSAEGGSSRDPRITCAIEAPDGRRFEATAFTRQHLYWSLMTTLCDADIHLAESDYVRRFSCGEPVVPPGQ